MRSGGPGGSSPAKRSGADQAAAVPRAKRSAEGGSLRDFYDLVVIGSGPAGEKAAAQAAYFGKRVAVVERRPAPGGVAVSSAGVPTKTLRETALYLTGFRERHVYGLSLTLDPDAKLEHLSSRTAEVVETMTRTVQHNLDRHGIELVHGTAELGPDRTVVVSNERGERTLEAEVVLIAAGSRPYHPPGIPFDDPDVCDSEAILSIDRLPRKLVVVGGGAVGCEYASIFTALDVEVTLLDRSEVLVPFMDAEISKLLAETFLGMGMDIRFGVEVEAVERVDGRLAVRLSGGEVLEPDTVLFAAGRAGNTEGLGLERCGVEVDARGRILVDDRYRTTAPGVYAAGDVIGPPALASVSMEQGRVAVCHAFDIPFKETVDPLAPWGIYSIPEMAMVGMTEEEAVRAGTEYEVGRGWFRENTRSMIAGTTDGLIKLVFRREDRALLGVHILGEMAGELIPLAQSVIHEGGAIDHFIHWTFNVPTRVETYKYAAYDGLQRLAGRITPP